jgi:hypothetical protein
MATCGICKKKIKFLDEYSEEGVEGSFCKDCFKDKDKLKKYIQKQEEKKKEEWKKEKLEEEIKDKEIKEKVRKKTPLDVYAIIFLLYLGLIFSLGNLAPSYDNEDIQSQYNLHLQQPIEEGYRHLTYEEFEEEYKKSFDEIDNLNAGTTIIFLPFLIYIIYLAHKRKRRFVNWFIVYLWLISLMTLILSYEYASKVGIYIRFGIALFFTIYLKFSKEMNYAFYN